MVPKITKRHSYPRRVYDKGPYHRRSYVKILGGSTHPSIDDGGGSAKTPACDNDEEHDGDDEKPAESGVL